MPTEVTMPQMGFDMKEGRVARWLKKEGDKITRGETIAEIETDKAVVELEAFGSGVLRQILVPQGETVPVGQLIGVIAAPGEEVAAAAVSSPVARPPTKEEAPKAPPSQAKVALPEEETKASPIARRLAQEHGIDLRRVKGSGPGGRIVKEDVEAAIQTQGVLAIAPAKEAAPAPAAAPSAGEPSRMRQAIARRMSQSKREAPHFYLTVNVDMTAAMRLRAEINEGMSKEERVSINDMLVRACTLALQKFPYMNALYIDDKVQVSEAIHIGIAIALEDGLIAPAILDCQNKTLKQLPMATEDLTNRTKGGKLRPQEYSGATFTISNLGMYDMDNFIAIISPPQAAILAVGAVKPQPAVRDNQIVIAQMMTATLSVDHRVTDGAKAAPFLKEVKSLLEKPMTLLTIG